MTHEENAIHRALVEHLRLRSKRNTVWFHPFNKAASPREGAFAKSMGVRAGVSDLILVRNGRPYALELKSANGKLSVAQDTFLKEWEAAGGKHAVAFGLDPALWVLEEWGFL